MPLTPEKLDELDADARQRLGKPLATCTAEDLRRLAEENPADSMSLLQVLAARIPPPADDCPVCAFSWLRDAAGDHTSHAHWRELATAQEAAALDAAAVAMDGLSARHAALDAAMAEVQAGIDKAMDDLEEATPVLVRRLESGRRAAELARFRAAAASRLGRGLDHIADDELFALRDLVLNARVRIGGDSDHDP